MKPRPTFNCLRQKYDRELLNQWGYPASFAFFHGAEVSKGPLKISLTTRGLEKPFGLFQLADGPSVRFPDPWLSRRIHDYRYDGVHLRADVIEEHYEALTPITKRNRDFHRAWMGLKSLWGVDPSTRCKDTTEARDFREAVLELSFSARSGGLKTLEPRQQMAKTDLLLGCEGILRFLDYRHSEYLISLPHDHLFEYYLQQKLAAGVT